MIEKADIIARGGFQSRIGVVGDAPVSVKFKITDPLIVNHQIRKLFLIGSIGDNQFPIGVGLAQHAVNQLDEILFLRLVRRNQHADFRAFPETDFELLDQFLPGSFLIGKLRVFLGKQSLGYGNRRLFKTVSFVISFGLIQSIFYAHDFPIPRLTSLKSCSLMHRLTHLTSPRHRLSSFP